MLFESMTPESHQKDWKENIIKSIFFSNELYILCGHA